MPVRKQVTIIDLQTGEAKTSALKEIAKYLKIPEDRLKRYRLNKIRLFDHYCIAFTHEVIKQNRGNKHAFDNVNRKRGLIP